MTISENLINNFFSQFPIAFSIVIIGYFFINKMENYNKSIMEIAVNSTKAIENCTNMMKTIEESMKEIRTTQLEIKSDIVVLKNK